MSTSSVKSFFTALRAAFLYHWNLLYVGTVVAIGLISGRPDVVFPLAGAIEILYLSILAANPRFQTAAQADKRNGSSREGKENTQPDLPNAEQILQEIGREDRIRFKRLQELCQQLRKISKGLAGDETPDPSHIDAMQLSNLNRLLWIYLKMLYSKTCLEHFFKTINEKEIRAGLENARQRLQMLGPENEDDQKEAKHRRSLIDIRETLEARLKNHNNARENYDFLQLELERLYAKISGIVELGVNRQDAASVSTEIDVVSSSLIQTEKTIKELESITGFSFADEQPPVFLDAVQSMSLQNNT